MKLAEALQERADLNRRIEQLRSRISCNALVQEGEVPAEDPVKLLRELTGCLERLERLMVCINHTNDSIVVQSQTLTAWLARRDVLKMKLSALRDAAYAASQSTHRATRTEIKIIPVLNVRDLQKEIDDLARQLRLTDNAIQAANWTTELIEG